LLAHIDRANAPRDYAFFPARIPDDSIERLEPLPRGWNATPPTAESARSGDEWATSLRSLALIVPSVIVPSGNNLLINPRHPRFGEIAFDSPISHALDTRIVKS
jgi:RES domain-containing protein